MNATFHSTESFPADLIKGIKGLKTGDHGYIQVGIFGNHATQDFLKIIYGRDFEVTLHTEHGVRYRKRFKSSKSAAQFVLEEFRNFTSA